LITLGARLTDANKALFDAANHFRGCIPGIHEVLRRQGLLEGRWCLDPEEELSPGQLEEIDRVCREYPELNDDAFVRRHLPGAGWVEAGGRNGSRGGLPHPDRIRRHRLGRLYGIRLVGPSFGLPGCLPSHRFCCGF